MKIEEVLETLGIHVDKADPGCVIQSPRGACR
jgi:hypothetical protein